MASATPVSDYVGLHALRSCAGTGGNERHMRDGCCLSSLSLHLSYTLDLKAEVVISQFPQQGQSLSFLVQRRAHCARSSCCNSSVDAPAVRHQTTGLARHQQSALPLASAIESQSLQLEGLQRSEGEDPVA